ncbi:MAG: prephenate dehydratase [Desulfobacterales bacterium]|nr:prephenate dehydratase [Desulfobacterales bacterium]MDD3082728.1 prephenate dehydratase [Desulfobacterales bacterium]MDD3951278.1 prephenate dehydratase [Desulfobacterales bacterium]
MTEHKDDRISIEDLRRQIDQIDQNILKLINQRLMLAQQIGNLKGLNGAPVLDPDREARLMKSLCDANKGPLKTEELRHIFSEIIAAARRVQRPIQIAFLGPEATFTHLAALKHFGHLNEFVPQENIYEIFSQVERGKCHYGVVPVENSIEGAVNHTLDLLFESTVSICGEIYSPISHALLCKNGRPEDIREIFSHPQALAQCRRWLDRHLPDAVIKTCESTGYAARMAAERPDAGAIASCEAAQIYGLQVAAWAIEDSSRNTTRFIMIGKDAPAPTANDKTSIMLVTAHRPGALYHALQPIADAGINMVKLESRPTKQQNWSYFFFVELDGHQQDPPVRTAIDQMRSLCLYLKILGSYPKAQG